MSSASTCRSRESRTVRIARRESSTWTWAVVAGAALSVGVAFLSLASGVAAAAVAEASPTEPALAAPGGARSAGRSARSTGSAARASSTDRRPTLRPTGLGGASLDRRRCEHRRPGVVLVGSRRATASPAVDVAGSRADRRRGRQPGSCAVPTAVAAAARSPHPRATIAPIRSATATGAPRGPRSAPFTPAAAFAPVWVDAERPDRRPGRGARADSRARRRTASIFRALALPQAARRRPLDPDDLAEAEVAIAAAVVAYAEQASGSRIAPVARLAARFALRRASPIPARRSPRPRPRPIPARGSPLQSAAEGLSRAARRAEAAPDAAPDRRSGALRTSTRI